MDLFLGLDVGTTACKAVVYDAAGAPVSAAERGGYAVHRAEPNWAEQDAADWWRAAQACLSDVVAALPGGSRIAAIGLAGQWSQLFVDHDGRPVGRAIIWQDGRADREAADLSTVDAATWREWQGADLPQGAATPPARLLWLRRHRPEMIAPGVRMLQAKDWVAYRLTDRVATDLTSAVWIVNQRTGRIDPGLAGLLGVDERLLPPLHRPYDVMGAVTAAAANEIGIPPGTPVIAGWIDTWAGILGTGLGIDSCAFDLAGTSEAVGIAGPSPVGAAHGLLDVPLDGATDVVYGLTNAGADSFRWAAESLYPETSLKTGFARMEGEAATASAADGGLIFLPYLTGERSPVWDPAVRGAFVGLDRAHTRAHLARAVYEGLAFCVRQLLDGAAAATGVTPKAMRVSGGGATSSLANQIKADAAGIRVETVDAPDAGTLGAAMLAAIGSGRHSDYAAAIAAMVRVGNVYLPNPKRHAELAAAYDLYGDLYAALAPLSRRREVG